MNITIEEAKRNDLQAILDLFALPDMDNGNVLSIDEAGKIFDKMSQYPNYKTYIARDHQIIVGTFSLIIVENIIHCGGASGLVESVVVDNRYRSKGIGKMMMEFAIQKCKESKCYKMSLSSKLIRERAHSFYENLGFKRHGYSFLIEL
jgi:GNAT superfamily N-acetyltransferase